MPSTPSSASTPAMASEEPTTPTGPNPQEAMLFFNIFKNVKGQPDIDWEQVAKDSGLKNGATAKKRFYQIKIKHGLEVKTPRKARGSGSQDELELAVEQHTPVKSETSEGQSSAKSSVKSTNSVKSARSAKSTPTKITKRRKMSALKSVKTESDEPNGKVADSFYSIADSIEPANAAEAAKPSAPLESPAPAAPKTPVRTTNFVAINSPPVTPVKAKSSGRTPLPTGKPGRTSSPLANETSDGAPAALKQEPSDEYAAKAVVEETGVCALIAAALDDHKGI